MSLWNRYPTRDLGGWIMYLKSCLEKHFPGIDDRDEDFGYFLESLKDIEDGVNERTELLHFLKSILHNERFFLEDGMNVSLGNDITCKYSSLRKQLYLSLFAMIGGVYDSSARFCMLALDKGSFKKKDIKSTPQIHNIFFNERYDLIKGHQDEIGPLRGNCGYFLGMITFFRNLFIHRGESFFNGKDLFLSIGCKHFDSLNPEILSDIEDAAHTCYKIRNYSIQYPDIKSYAGKSLFEMLNAYLLQADHGIGCLLMILLAKHVGIL